MRPTRPKSILVRPSPLTYAARPIRRHNTTRHRPDPFEPEKPR